MNRSLLFLAASFIALSLFAASPAAATQLFAEQTGKNCEYCHVGKPDDLTFTPDGELFIKNYYQLPSATRPSNTENQDGLWATAKRKLRRLVLAVHSIASVALLGTLLFLGLAPRPANQDDLTTAERQFLWAALAVTGICGGILFPTVYVPEPSFRESTYGIYLGIKMAVFVLLAAVVAARLLFSAKLSGQRRAVETLLAGAEPPRFSSFSRADLRLFTGRQGRRALIAFKGKVYDVTEARHWHQGLHFSKHSAGTDLTEAIHGAPHGDAVLFSAKEAGIYDPLMAGSGNEEIGKMNRLAARTRTLNRFGAALAAGLAIVLAFWRQ